MRWLLLAVFVFSASSISVGQSGDGNKLLERCQHAVKMLGADASEFNKTNAFDSGYCLGMVEGVVSFADDGCFPADVTFAQGERVVVKYLTDHPNQLHWGAPVLVRLALVDAFPCPAKK